MASAVENFTFNELPRRLVVDSSIDTGLSLTAGWVLVASGIGFQAIPTDPSLLGFEPTVAPATSDPTTKYYRGDKTWQTLNATAVGAIASSEKGIALGVATLDADGYVLLSQMNPSVIERVVIVADEAARYALTTLDVQNGDVVNQQSPLPSTMWFVVDQDNLDSSGGYLPFSAGVAGSVAWSGVTGKPAIIGDLEDISLAAEGDLIQFVSGNWIKVNAATLKTSLSIQTSDVSGLDTALGKLQPKGNNLTAVTDLATDGIMVMTNAGTATAEVQAKEITVSAPLKVTNGTGVDDNPNISLNESGVAAGTYGDDLNYATFEVTSKGLLSDAGVRSIERPSLIIPNATVDYYLSNRTRHILGVAGTYGALSLILPAGDTLQSGSWVEIIVNEDLVEFTDSVIISATGTQSVNNVSSINLVSYGLYPGSRIYCVYEHLSSEWVVTVNNNNTFRSLTVVNPASTDFNESHLIESAALQPRTVLLPDADVDLTKVSQAASTSTDGYLTATDWNAFSSTEFIDSTLRIIDDVDDTKKAAFDVSGIATGNMRTITVPNADVSLGKVPTGVTPTYATGRLMVPLADGTSIPLSAFGGTRLPNLNSPATVLAANGHYLFYSNTGSYYTVICALVLPTAPDDTTYVRISNISSLNSFSTDAGATVAPGGSDKINGVAATFSITDYLVNYRNAVITFTYSAFSENWTVSVLGDLIRPRTIAIYDADKTNSTTLTPVADLTDNRVITLPDADVNLGKVAQAATTSVDGYLTSTDWTTFNGKQAALVSGTNIKTVNGSSLLGSDNLTITTPTTFSDIAFRIQDNNNATKQIAFEASGITAGQTRTVTMPDSPVNLGQMMNTVTVLGAYTIPEQESSVNPAQRYHLVMYGSYSIDFNNIRGLAQVTNVTAASITVTITAGVASFKDDAGTAITNFTLVAGETAYLTQAGTIITLRRYTSAGKIPASLSFNAATAVLTQTLADSTSLSADLSAIAVNQVALTGGSTVTVTGTQSSTKYFLAGSTVSTFDVTAFTNTGKFIEIVNNRGSYSTITLTATGRDFRDEVGDLITFPVIVVRGESLFVFPVNATTLQVYRNKPDVRNIKNNSNTITSGFKTTNLFVDSSTTVGQIAATGDELVRIFALANCTLSFGNPVYDARTNTQISTGSYTMYAGQVIEATKTAVSKWVILGGHIQDTSRFRLYNSSNVPTKFDTSAATAERTITMPDADVNLGALKSLNTMPVGLTNLVQLRAGHDYFVTQSGVILGIQTTSALGLYDTSIGYSFSNTTSSDLTVTVRWTAGTGTPGLVQHIDAISGSTIAVELLTLTPTYDYVYTLPKGGTIRLLPNVASNVTILRSFSEFYGQSYSQGNFMLWCQNTILKGSNNTATHCRNITVNANQKDASFTDMWDILNMNGAELGNGETDLLFPRGSKVVGFNRNDNSTGNADMFTCTTMFHLLKTANSAVTVADQAGVLPYVAFGTVSGGGFGSFLNVGHHVLEVALGGGFIQEFTILAYKNAGVYILTASEQTKRTPAASNTFLNLTTTIVNNRLSMVLELNAPYNSNSAYITAKLTSYYNINF